jgi:hypothetical protein
MTMLRVVLGCAAAMLACTEHGDPPPSALVSPPAAPTQVEARAEITPPAPPVPRQWFERDDLDPRFEALPPSRQATARTSMAKVLVEVSPHATRPDSARVVIDGEIVEDFRTPQGKRLLARWFDAKHLVPGIGMDTHASGFVVAAAVGVDTDVLVEILAFAAGRRLDGPVELALRRGGTRQITTIPIALGDTGEVPIAGAWGEWARALDDAWIASANVEPLVLSIGDAAGDAYDYRDRLPRIGAVTRIGAIEVGEGLRASTVRQIVQRHRNQVTSCFVQALMHRPVLAGTWTASMTVDREGRVTAPLVQGTDDHGLFPACLERALQRWTFPKPRQDVAVTMTFDLSSAG